MKNIVCVFKTFWTDYFEIVIVYWRKRISHPLSDFVKFKKSNFCRNLFWPSPAIAIENLSFNFWIWDWAVLELLHYLSIPPKFLQFFLSNKMLPGHHELQQNYLMLQTNSTICKLLPISSVILWQIDNMESIQVVPIFFSLEKV